MFEISLKSNKKYSASPDSSLLDEAIRNGVVLEHSCRAGRCGVCKSRVLKGSTSILQDEVALTTQELNEGVVLTCCRAAESDISLDIIDLDKFADIKVQTLPCRIDLIEKLTPDIIRVVLRLPPTASFEYIPGQYLEVIWQGIRRSYSIANAQREDNKLELQIGRVEKGALSEYWFETAKPNDLLRFEGPLGTFCLRESAANNIVFIATGTGIAPVKAMLEQISQDNELFENKRILVYWGGRSPENLYWQPELIRTIEFIPVLSGNNDDWRGKRGYVQNALLEDNVDLADAVVYACGSESMTLDAKKLLTENGLVLSNFYSDAFVSSN